MNVANNLHVQCETVNDKVNLENFWALEGISVNSDKVTPNIHTETFLKEHIFFKKKMLTKGALKVYEGLKVSRSRFVQSL